MALIIITGGGPLIIAVGIGIKLYSQVLNSSRDRRCSISRVVEGRNRGIQLSLFRFESSSKLELKEEDSCASMILINILRERDYITLIKVRGKMYKKGGEG